MRQCYSHFIDKELCHRETRADRCEARQVTENKSPIIILINLTIIIVLPQIQYLCPHLKHYTGYVMKVKLFWHLFFPNLLLIMCPSKFLARKRIRHQDDKAKCNGVKEPETVEEAEGSLEKLPRYCAF